MALVAQVENPDELSWAAALAIAGLTGLIMIAVGYFLIEIALRGADGRLAKNRLAGIRTSATLGSDEAWAAAHRSGLPLTLLAGRASIATGIAPIVIAGAMGALGLASPTRFLLFWTVLLLVGVAAMTAFAIAGAVKGHRAAKAVHEAE